MKTQSQLILEGAVVAAVIALWVLAYALVEPGKRPRGPAPGAERAKCLQCDARRIWINKHQRGDASLGFVMHEYSVTHEV